MLNLPEPFNDFLSPEECAQIDRTLLPTRDRFSIRIAVYSWRYLQQVSAGLGTTIAELQPQQIEDWLGQDVNLQIQAQADEAFIELFERLLMSALAPLRKIALQESVAIEQLKFQQIVDWFEGQVKATL
ncbi:hypothetical protein [Altericista sp. CCNU0014]|uniref:hypothetical protein n=1 Tax=Altericista sp. CCNU0014 TaxID=3082949 RepID=UPI00384ADD5D